MPLIPGDQEFAIWAVLVALIAAGFLAEQKTRIGARLTAIVVTMTLAMILANIRVLPTESPVYDSIFSDFLPVAIPLMLFRANLRKIISEAGPMFLAFVIGGVGVVLGVLLAFAIIPLGDIADEVAGLYTATYIGGSLNFAAVASATDFQEGATLTSLIAADIVAGEIQMIVLILLPALALMRRLFPVNGNRAAPAPESGDAEASATAQMPYTLRNLDLFGLTLALTLALAFVYAGNWLASEFDSQPLAILFTSIFALIVANGAPGLVARMSGDYEVSLILIFLFLAAIAATADVWVLAETGPIFFYYAAILLSVHTAVMLVAGRFLKIELSEIIIASTACVGGATSAGAIASAKGWRHLIAPGILVATFGNATGHFIGVWMWKLLG